MLLLSVIRENKTSLVCMLHGSFKGSAILVKTAIYVINNLFGCANAGYLLFLDFLCRLLCWRLLLYNIRLFKSCTNTSNLSAPYQFMVIQKVLRIFVAKSKLWAFSHVSVAMSKVVAHRITTSTGNRKAYIITQLVIFICLNHYFLF